MKRAERKSQKLADRLKGLGTVIDGNTAQVGKPSGRYDSYKYDGFRFEGCTVGWREAHESSEAEKFLFKEIHEFAIPLAGLSQTSIRVDKIGASAYVISFTSLKLKQSIASRVKTTHQDGSEDEANGYASGTGIYFQNEDIARQVSKVLATVVSYCQKQTAP
ncbi:MAG TPA: hypothetical protein VMZ30_12700 [Pyrinomonadaceae bacterium]|nr:hypothetical protein [Pyrinomonadaceae bacterium]